MDQGTVNFRGWWKAEAHLAQTAYATMPVDGFPAAKDQMAAAVGLQSMGLHAGDQVAVIGDGNDRRPTCGHG
jgi:hypothetical protein